jgi:hypothetical protein
LSDLRADLESASALARGLSELRGGQLEVHSAGRDKGCELLLRLPVSGPAPTVPTVAVEDPVDGADPQPGIREVHASPQKGLERHFVKPRYWAALRGLLSCFQADTGTLRN